MFGIKPSYEYAADFNDSDYEILLSLMAMIREMNRNKHCA